MKKILIFISLISLVFTAFIITASAAVISDNAGLTAAVTKGESITIDICGDLTDGSQNQVDILGKKVTVDEKEQYVPITITINLTGDTTIDDNLYITGEVTLIFNFNGYTLASTRTAGGVYSQSFITLNNDNSKVVFNGTKDESGNATSNYTGKDIIVYCLGGTFSSYYVNMTTCEELFYNASHLARDGVGSSSKCFTVLQIEGGIITNTNRDELIEVHSITAGTYFKDCSLVSPLNKKIFFDDYNDTYKEGNGGYYDIIFENVKMNEIKVENASGKGKLVFKDIQDDKYDESYIIIKKDGGSYGVPNCYGRYEIIASPSCKTINQAGSMKTGIIDGDGVITKDEFVLEPVDCYTTDDHDCTTENICDCCDTTVIYAKLADKHTGTFVSIAYPQGFNAKGERTVECTNDNCLAGDTKTESSPIFVAIGYSYKLDTTRGHGIAGGYEVNHKALKKYQDFTGNTVEFGVVMFNVNSDQAKASEKLFENGVITITQNAIQIKSTATAYSTISFRINGFAEKALDLELAIALYVNEIVTDGESKTYTTTFVQSEYGEEDKSVINSYYTKGGVNLSTVTCYSVTGLTPPSEEN